MTTRKQQITRYELMVALVNHIEAVIDEAVHEETVYGREPKSWRIVATAYAAEGGRLPKQRRWTMRELLLPKPPPPKPRSRQPFVAKEYDQRQQQQK